MPLSGTFDTIELTDLLQWIHTVRKSGTLTVSLDVEDTFLLFNEGDLVAIGSDNSLRLDLGQVLLNRDLISEEQLGEIIRTTPKGGSLARRLVESGLFDEAAIVAIHSEHAFETTLDLFFYEEGSFLFSRGESSGLLPPDPEIPPAGFLKKPISLKEVIFEGIRRLDEWNRFKEVFPSSYVVIHAGEGESASPIWRQLKEVSEPLSIGEFCLRVGGSRFSVYKALYEAHRAGLVLLDLMMGERVKGAPIGPEKVLLDNARLLLSELQFDEARAVLSTVANIDPDNTEVHKLLRRVRDEQLEHLYQQIPHHRIPVLAVDPKRLKEFQLSPRENYLASRLEGRWDVATLVMITPLGELETLRILWKFLHGGIAKLT